MAPEIQLVALSTASLPITPTQSPLRTKDRLEVQIEDEAAIGKPANEISVRRKKSLHKIRLPRKGALSFNLGVSASGRKGHWHARLRLACLGAPSGVFSCQLTSVRIIKTRDLVGIFVADDEDDRFHNGRMHRRARI